MEFLAIDVETANADVSSICQVGIAHFSNFVVVNEWKSYVDPEDDFDPINVSIHGIDEARVRGAPRFATVAPTIHETLHGKIVVSHTHFDRVAIINAWEKHRLGSLSCNWLDSARVARRTWEHCRWRGYGLAPICKFLGYQF